jgi:hypothetical protein
VVSLCVSSSEDLKLGLKHLFRHSSQPTVLSLLGEATGVTVMSLHGIGCSSELESVLEYSLHWGV